MPRYCFRRPSGELIEKTMTVAEMTALGSTFLDGETGEVLTRDIVAEHQDVAHAPGNWPMTSESAAVHPDQIGEAIAVDKRKGVPTEYTSDGSPIFTSRDHRRRYCEAHGFYDKSGGYSDPQKRR